MERQPSYIPRVCFRSGQGALSRVARGHNPVYAFRCSKGGQRAEKGHHRPSHEHVIESNSERAVRFPIMTAANRDKSTLPSNAETLRRESSVCVCYQRDVWAVGSQGKIASLDREQ